MRKEYSLHLDYSVPLGDTYSKFFEGLKNKKLLGNRCKKCNRLYVPARPYCDICCEETSELFDVEADGIIISYTVYYIASLGLPKPPFAQGIIKIGEAANSFLHYIGGIEFSDADDLKDKISIGMKVKPVWAENRTGDIMDIEYFEPLK